MKKLLAILLALAMVMSLAACGSAPADEDNKDDDNEVVQTTEEPTEEETTEPVTEPENEKAQVADDIVHGSNEGDLYVNESLNLSFTLPSDSWTFYSEDQIAALLDSTGSLGNNPQAYLERFGLFYDMLCVDSGTGDSVQIIVQDVSNFGIDTDEFDDIADVYIDSIIQGASGSATITNVSDYEDVTLGSETYRKAVADVSANGVNCKQAYYVCPGGDYVVCIAVTAVSANILSEIEACFG